MRGSLNEGTSLENIESQTQQDLLYLELPNRVEEAKKKQDVRAMFEVMADVAGTNEGTPSMMEEVDDSTPLEHVSTKFRVVHHEDGTAIGSPNRIDAVAKSTMEDPMGRPEIKWHPVTESQSKRIAEDQGDRILRKMTKLFQSMELIGTNV